MFRNNLKIAWRNLVKDRQFTILNLLGLSTGLACALMIYLWVNDELGYDRFFDNAGQIYQVMEKRDYRGHEGISDESSGLLSKTIRAQMSEVEFAASVAPPEWFQKFTLSVGEKNIKASGQYVGTEYFDIFSFRMLDGKNAEVLKDKNSIVISADLARRLFGTTENLIGKPVRFQHETNFFVSGVFENLPRQSSQQFDFALSFEYFGDSENWVRTWGNTGPHNFVLLKKGTDINVFNQRIAGIIRKNSDDTSRTAFAIPFTSSYLQNSFVHGAKVGERIGYVRLFSVVALFILAIACINFMNLSTAKASRRLKEVGIKKVVGADRNQLIFQFLTESVILTCIALIFSLLIVLLLLPQFNTLTGKNLSLFPSPAQVGTLLGIAVFTGLAAGSYPAFYLSGFDPIAILKTKLSSSIGEVWVRKGLVVFQFSITITLIISVLVIYRQISMIQSINLGFSKDNIIRIRSEGKLLSSEKEFISELKKMPGVVSASHTTHDMVGRNFGGDMIEWPGREPNQQYYFEGMNVGYDFVETMGMEMAQGRSFSRNFGSDSTSLLFNETAVRTMGLKNPIGQTVKWFGQKMQIVGVVKDFHFESLHQPVAPVYLALEGSGNIWDKIVVKIQGTDQKETISRIENLYEKFNPGFPFEFNFLDEAYQKQYDGERRVSILSGYFAGLAIIISCLGLFGLAAFTAQRRQKEIGIRKIIGATTGNIFIMLSKDFIVLVIAAILVAFPLSWWAMNQWLQNFAYRVNVSLLAFVVAGAAILLITLMTISYQVIKAAVASPAGSLRTE